MDSEKIEIRKVSKDELPLIRNLPPSDWNIDLEAVYRQHYDQQYFYPVIASFDSEIAGTGIAVVNGNATWLGIIVVKEQFRNMGIGKFITNHLINYSKSLGNETILLSASELGLPVYRNIGFEHDLNYLFFKSDNPSKLYGKSKYISDITKNDHDGIFELDLAITGERRVDVLKSSLKTGFVYKDKIVKGYYLPDLGSGLIIADSENSGIELLKYKLLSGNSSICIPETNNAAIDYLKSIGFYQNFKTPRMFLNKNVKWYSENVYSRGCGYLG
jgi:GNAT superfamily N-acetyltransferase